MEFINAVKDRVVGAVEENVGYFTGNHEMEQRGHDLRNTANVQDPTHENETYTETSNNNNLSAVAALRDAHHDAIMNQDVEKSSSDNSSSSFSLTPSLFSRNQPDPESSAHGAVKDQIHNDTIAHWESVSRDVTDKPEVKPINTDGHSALPPRDQWSNDSSVPNSSESGSTWMDKLGSIMGGSNKDEAQTFWRTTDNQENKQDEGSVMDKLREAHMDATNPQKGMTETVKEKFDNWSQSASNMMSGNSNNRGMTENMQDRMSDMKDTVQDRVVDMKDTVQEKVGDMKDQVDSMWNKSGPTSHSVDALPDSSLPIVKHDATADIPDPNFIQNA